MKADTLKLEMTLRRHLVLLLFPALLLAQWLGLAHSVTHARLAAPSAIAALAATPVASPSGFDALFSGHDAVSCRLLDQLGHGDAPPCVVTQFAPAALPGFLAPVVTGRLMVALAAGFQARAPPILR